MLRFMKELSRDRFPSIRLFVKGIVLGFCSLLLAGFFLILLALLSGLLSGTEAGYSIVMGATLVVLLLYHLSLVGIGIWVGLKASSRGWLLAGSLVFALYSVFALLAMVDGRLKTGGVSLLVGASLAGLSALGSYAGELAKKRRATNSNS